MSKTGLLKTAFTANIGLLVFSSAAWAQSPVDEIIVTAQKKAESVQDVPITIAAFSEETLDETGFDGISDLANMTPSLQFGNFGPIAFVVMRGIGSDGTTAGTDPGVALHFDGVYLGRPVGTTFTAFDSERVEILKGPQGTLYGRNATGGSINYITKKPDSEYGGEVDITYGNFNWLRGRAAINIPLGDRVATRIVGFVEDRDGFTQNSFDGGTEANDAENWGLRGHLNFDIDDTASLLLSANYVNAGGAGSKTELREPYPGSQTGQNLAGPPIPPNNYIVNGAPIVNDLEPFRVNHDSVENLDSDFLLLSATVEKDFGPVIVKSISGYVETSYDSISDSDGSFLPIASLQITEDANQFSQELQFLSNTDSPFQWIAGLYYFNEEADRRSDILEGRFDIVADNLGTDAGFSVGGEIETKSYAAFGQASYELTDNLTITGGLRYTDDEKSGRNSGNQLAPAYDGEVGASWDQLTYRAAVDWQTNQDTLVFASYSKGYKSGGVNQVVNPLSGSNPIFDPEFVDAFEVGLKTAFADRRLRLNISAYNNDYEGLQFQVFTQTGLAAFNADKATVRGLEVEAQAYLSETFSLNGTLGLTDAEYGDQILQGVNIGGNELARTPDLTYTVGVINDWELGNAGTLRARADLSYTDEIFYSAFNRNAGPADPGGSDLAEAYTTVNARLIWRDNDDKWNAELFATNIFDENQESNIVRGIGLFDVAGGGGPEQIQYNPPRQYGVRIGRNF